MRTGRPVIRACPEDIYPEIWKSALQLYYKHKILESQIRTCATKLQELREIKEVTMTKRQCIAHICELWANAGTKVNPKCVHIDLVEYDYLLTKTKLSRKDRKLRDEMLNAIILAVSDGTYDKLPVGQVGALAWGCYDPDCPSWDLDIEGMQYIEGQPDDGVQRYQLAEGTYEAA